MNIKHKLLKDFQYITDDKQIFILKSGSTIENYIYKIKDNIISLDKDIINNNSDYFKVIDWKTEIVLVLKSQKIPQPSIVAKKIIPFINDLLISNSIKEEEIIVDYDQKLEKELNDNILKEKQMIIDTKNNDIEYLKKINFSIEKELNDIRKELELKTKNSDNIPYRKEIEYLKEKLEKTEKELLNTQLNINIPNEEDGLEKSYELHEKIKVDMVVLMEKEMDYNDRFESLLVREKELEQKTILFEEEKNKKIKEINNILTQREQKFLDEQLKHKEKITFLRTKVQTLYNRLPYIDNKNKSLIKEIISII